MKKLLFVFLAVWMALMPMDLGLAYHNNLPLLKKLAKNFINQSEVSGDHPQVTLTVHEAEGYLHEDENWPIVRQEKYTYIDEETSARHVHETIWRESPLGYSAPQESPCPQDGVSAVAKQIAASAACVYVGNVSRTDVDTITFSGGSVTHRIKLYAQKYCDGGCENKQLYKAYQVDTWWTRTSTSSSVQNATLQWGCDAACIKCDGSNWSAVHSWGPTTIAWSSSYASYVYTFTNSSWPAVTGLLDQVLKGISRSDVYHGGSKKGSTFVKAGFP